MLIRARLVAQRREVQPRELHFSPGLRWALSQEQASYSPVLLVALPLGELVDYSRKVLFLNHRSRGRRIAPSKKHWASLHSNGHLRHSYRRQALLSKGSLEESP